jgi:hypothetical protein
MTGWNLPPGCTDRMVDEAYGYSSGRRGKYTVTVTRTATVYTKVEIWASSEDDAREDAIIEAKEIPLDEWNIDQLDYDTTDVEGPPERDPDDERDARADYEYDRNR